MQRSRFISIFFAAVLIIASISLVLVHVAQTPERVFSDMLRNNLSTSGVTRIVKQSGQGVAISQYTQLSLGARPQAHSLTLLQQGGGKLATEEISDADTDLVRYQKVDLPGAAKNKASAIVGKWAKLESNGSAQTGLTSGLFKQSLLGTLPLGNLQSTDRNKLLDTIKKTNVLSYKSADVKRMNIDGKDVYRYDVSIKSSAYITMMQQFEKLVGQTAFKDINPATYTNAAPIALQVDVATEGHQLTRIYQVATKRAEAYQGFGVTDKTPLPKAMLTTTELTKLLSGA